MKQEDPNQLVKDYIEEMNNYDPDLQEMGAKYLSELVLKDKVNLIENPQMARKITQNFLKQVASQSFAVHSSAIRFLAEMVPKLPKNELVHIFHQTISAIAKVDTKPERRQIFSTSAGTMIHLAPDDFGHALSNLFVESIHQLMNAETKNSDIEMLLLNVITEFTRKWPNVAKSHDVKFDRRGFIQHLLKNIESSNKLLLIRKSDGALGKVCLTFDKENFQFLFNEKEWGLLNFIRKYMKSSDEEDLKHLRNGTMCLAHILKASNPDMKPWVRQITYMSLQLIEEQKSKDLFPDITTQIIQSALSCLTYIIRAYSSEIKDLLSSQSEKLYEFLEEMLDFDLEGMMTYIQPAMDEEDDYGGQQYDYSDDSICWKVRAAALKYVANLLHRHKKFREEKARSQQFLNLLSNKLVEENETVSKMAFETFNHIIQAISTPKNAAQLEEQMGLKRVKSSEGDFGMNIVNQISNQIGVLFENKKTKEQIKTEASKTLLFIIELLKQLVKQNQELHLKLLNLVISLVSKVNVDSCINLLRALRSLMSENVPISKVQETLQLYLKYVKDSHLKVVSTSYSGIKTIEKVYGVALADQGKFNDILEAVLWKMKQYNADKQVKVSVVKCLGPIFNKIMEKLNQSDQNKILEVVMDKLQVEIDKSIILHQLSQFSNDFPMKKSQQKYFKVLLEQVSKNLGSADFQLNHNAIESCDRLINIQKHSLNDKTVQVILDRSRPLLFSGKLPKFLIPLIDTYPSAFKDYSEVIVRTAQSFYIMKLMDKKIIDSKSCLEILMNSCKAENSKKISLILSQLKIDEKYLMKEASQSLWGLICMGSLGYTGDLKTAEYLFNTIQTNKSDQVKFEAARAVGNIASRYPDLLQKLISITSKAEDGYLYIFAIKEMLCFSTAQFPQLPNLISFLFQKSQENSRQTNQYVIAESIGEVSRISPKQMNKILKQIPNMNETRKCIVGNSLRYAYEGKFPENNTASEETEFYIESIMNLTFDKSLNVKYGAMKSLNSIKNSYSFVVQSLISDKFINQLLDSLLIKDENIIIVDYGVNKEKKDLGKPLRIEAFNFLKAIMSFRIMEGKYEQIVAKSIDRMNEQTSNDLILKRVSIIRNICEKDYTLFIPYQNQFQTKVGIEKGVLKAHQKAVTADDERNEGYLKSLLKEILEMRNIADKEGNDQIRSFMNNIKRSERLSKYVDDLEK